MLELLIPNTVLVYLVKVIAALVAIIFTHITIQTTTKDATPYMSIIKNKSEYQPYVLAMIALGAAYGACGSVQVSMLAAGLVFTAKDFI